MITVKSQYLPPGYWWRPELTRSAFTFDAIGIGFYRTGDLGYRLPDGCLVYAGRKDSQAKIRGYRVEISEIETALLVHPAIREAAVAVGEEESGAQKLLAYMVAREGHRPANGALRSHLAGWLPPHMIPAAFTWLERLPLAQTGKLDRLALSRYGDASAELDTEFAEPRTPVERALVQIWGEVLKVPRIGIHDNFFDLGGHSLSATQVIARVKKTFELDIQLRTLFESPTVAGFSALIVQSQAEALGEDELTQLLTEAEEHGEQPERTLDRGRK